MSLTEIYNIWVGILLIACAGFIAVPVWSKLRRNLVLARKGSKTMGLYQGNNTMSFSLQAHKRITFSTWRSIGRHCNIGDQVPILYDPANPYRAEVMSEWALWSQPLFNLTLAAAATLTAVLLFLGVNIATAIVLMFVEWLVCSFLAKFALYYLYPPSRRLFQPEKQEQPRKLETQETAIQPIQETPPVVHHATRRERREQLLRDMYFGFDTPDAPPSH